MQFKLKTSQSFTFGFLVVAFVLLIFTSDSHSQTMQRNLEEYKEGGLFDLVNQHFPEGNKEKAPLREYMWDLWQNKRKAYFDVKYYNIEGFSTQCRYFIEPNLEGEWRIVSECKTSQCPYVSKKACHRFLKQVFVDSYDRVERIQYRYKDAMRTERKILNDEKVAFTDYVLRLRNTNGEIQEI